MDVQFTLRSLANTVADLWTQYRQYTVWALHGEMGSGKTTLVHAVCEMLGVKDVISSPTFAIINEYASPTTGIIYHMDWYRLKNEEEAIHAGIEDALLSGHFCLVEWPDKAAGLLPPNTLHLFIETIDENTRRLFTLLPSSGEDHRAG